MKDERARAAARFHDAFADFTRNGRWGTCVACPCDGTGRKLPELCENTSDQSHQLTIDGLANQFKLQLGIERAKANAPSAVTNALGAALDEYRARWRLMRDELSLAEARAILVADRGLGIALAQEGARLIAAGRSPAERIPPDFDAAARDAWGLLATAAHDLIEASKAKP